MRRFRMDKQSEIPENWAEVLLNLGGRVKKLLRRHLGVEQAAQHLRYTPETCLLALGFASCDDPVFQLRAIVESWPRSRIQADLRQRERACT